MKKFIRKKRQEVVDDIVDDIFKDINAVFRRYYKSLENDVEDPELIKSSKQFMRFITNELWGEIMKIEKSYKGDDNK